MLHQNSASKIVSKLVLARTFDLSQGDYTDKQIYNRLLIVPSKKILRTRLREYIILTCQDFIKCFLFYSKTPNFKNGFIQNFSFQCSSTEYAKILSALSQILDNLLLVIETAPITVC